LLWRIEGSETYILASIHAMDRVPYQLSFEAEAAYARSVRIAFEGDFTQAPDLSRFLLPSGERLSDQLAPQLFAMLQERWREAGLPEPALERSPAWLAALTLMITLAAQRGIVAANGVDMRLWERAARDKRQIVTLESPGIALQVFAAASAAEQRRFLAPIVEDTQACLGELEMMNAAWRKGSEKPFEDILEQRRHQAPQLFAALIARRSATWIPRLLTFARDGVPTLACLGALHCVGSIGIPTLLAQSGLKTTRVD